MAEVTVSQEAVKKLQAEAQQIKKSERLVRWLMGLMAVSIGVAVVANVVDVFSKRACSHCTDSGLNTVSVVLLFGILYTNMMVNQLKQTIAQLFEKA